MGAYDTIVKKQVEESKLVAALEGVVVPTTVDEYEIKHKAPEECEVDSSDDEKYIVELDDSDDGSDMDESEDTADEDEYAVKEDEDYEVSKDGAKTTPVGQKRRVTGEAVAEPEAVPAAE